LGPIADAVRALGEIHERQEAAAPRDRGDSLDIKPAQKARPSPESITARKLLSFLSCAPASAIARNMAGSSAFILSVRWIT
jgi:hypothetical protein